MREENFSMAFEYYLKYRAALFEDDGRFVTSCDVEKPR